MPETKIAKHIEAGESSSGDVNARLINAAYELMLERGYRGATTREIAQHAGVTEMTLFRHFSSKEALLRRSIEASTIELSEVVPLPSNDLVGDLLTLIERYTQMWEKRMPTMLELLPEIARNPELKGDALPEGVLRFRDRLFTFFAHYQQAGLLLEESPEEAAFAFVGPIFVRMIFEKSYGLAYTFDAIQHVRHFLHGRLAVRRHITGTKFG